MFMLGEGLFRPEDIKRKLFGSIGKFMPDYAASHEQCSTRRREIC